MTEPRFAYATHELAIVARDLRDTRAAGDPKAVAEGKLTQAQADERLRIADALAADWTAFDELRLPAEDLATGEEKLAMLVRAQAVIVQRRDKAHAAMLAEGAWLGELERGALWQLVDTHVSQTSRIEPYLHWESYGAALEALLWRQQQTGVWSKRYAVEVTLALRATRDLATKAAA